MNSRGNAICKRSFVPAFAILLAGGSGLAQESNSRTNPLIAIPQPATASPAAALSDALSAACSQNQTDFARLLTARNKKAFSRMTPAARPILRCETPDVITEMQIGGSEIQDNIAFLPMELRDATDTTGANVHQIIMGMVREDGEWRLLSLGLLLLDLPALEVEWDAAEMEATERGAVSALKEIAEAIERYRRSYSRLPESLAHLGSPVHGKANAESAGLLDSELATGVKNGYKFRYVVAGASTLGAPAKYQLAATPMEYGRTGRRSFFRDEKGGLHGADRQGAIGSETDPPVAQ